MNIMTLGVLPQSPLCRQFYTKPQESNIQSQAEKICRRVLPDCELIDNIKQYKEFYNRQIEDENSDFGVYSGIYDITDISEPEKDDKNLTFYVKDRNQVPLKVAVDLVSKYVHCGLLPTVY